MMMIILLEDAAITNHLLAGLHLRLLNFLRESKDCLRALSESSTRGGRDYWG